MSIIIFTEMTCITTIKGNILFYFKFLISFEAWAKLAQKWSLGIHIEPINKQLMLLVTI